EALAPIYAFLFPPGMFNFLKPDRRSPPSAGGHFAPQPKTQPCTRAVCECCSGQLNFDFKWNRGGKPIREGRFDWQIYIDRECIRARDAAYLRHHSTRALYPRSRRRRESNLYQSAAPPGEGRVLARTAGGGDRAGDRL